ncbi:hypothetical protein HYH03_003927 [Edaphochlamys debaryana]|uniref:Uncharacterized protein n=1 Tax=Edaphochlamys debaryana TaxID=47281 RepID=A0A835YB08_9CHLO|nr:hypothetical protein HYH03_003927 [Edaphochlamys debaryana]|eukprot:KAG2498172.1 hypothetical protein HYH03_003927 [Edaphochlamys debaryana]
MKLCGTALAQPADQARQPQLPPAPAPLTPLARETLPDGRTAVRVSTGTGIAAGFADPAVDVILVLDDVSLAESDWAAFDLPVHLGRRNVTLQGARPDVLDWVVIDFQYQDSRILIEPGFAFITQHIVIRNGRWSPHFVFMGWDLIAPQPLPGPGEPWPIVLLNHTAIHQRTCLPESVGQGSYSTIPRPPGLGSGIQTASSFLPQPGCTSDPWARPMQRCWPELGIYHEIATYGFHPDEFQRAQSSGYWFWLLEVIHLCDTVMTDECVASAGPLGCWKRMFPNAQTTYTNATPPAPPALSAPFLGRRASPPAALMAGAGVTPEGSTEDGGSSSATLAAALGGALGGAALLAALAAVAVLLVRRRGGLSAETTGAKTAADGEDGYDSLCLPVTPLTPPAAIPKGVRLGGEVQLLGVTRGKGAHGRVVEGMYGGRLVAVKMLDYGLIPEAAAGAVQPAAAGPAAAHVAGAPAAANACLPTAKAAPALLVIGDPDFIAASGPAPAEPALHPTEATAASPLQLPVPTRLRPDSKAVPSAAASVAPPGEEGAQAAAPAALTPATTPHHNGGINMAPPKLMLELLGKEAKGAAADGGGNGNQQRAASPEHGPARMVAGTGIWIQLLLVWSPWRRQ